MKPHLIKTALRNLHSTTLRTILAMLGILVGTAAVVAMVSTGQMATEQALAEFKSLGTDLIAVSLSNKQESNDAADTTFKLNDALALQTVSPAIESVAPYISVYAPFVYRGNTIDGALIGATDSLAQVVHIHMLAGRFISPVDHYEKYCVIGNGIYQKLKPYSNNVIGTKIKLGQHVFVIMGIADNWPENAFLYQDINNAIIIPIRTAKFFSKSADISNVVMRIDSHQNINDIKTAITHYLNNTVPGKEIFFRSAKELIKSMAAQHQIFTLLLTLIGSISLFVGGIGVMNIMLVSVLERRREIGIRLALGAHRKEIQWMFLTEAILLSFISGLLGVIVGILTSLIIAMIAHWKYQFFFLPIFIGFSVSVFIGVFFGFYPAHKAAQLDPIETLRAE